MNDLYLKCQEAARLIVNAEKLLYPGCENAVNVDFNTQNTQGSQEFSRTGTSDVTKAYNLPGELAAKISALFTDSPMAGNLGANELNLLSQLMTRSQTPTGNNELTALRTMSPTGYTGEGAIQNFVNRNPYSQDYEQATQALYDRSFDKARATAQSGPQNVRGGTARTGFELGELATGMSENRFKDIRQQQDKEAGVVQEAIQTANAIEQGRRGTQLQAAQQQNVLEMGRSQQSLDATQGVGRNRQIQLGNLTLASEMLGTPRQTETSNLSGAGQQIQSSQGTNFGLTCCFIFLEALNGKLPDFVRYARDYYCNANRRNGYNLMALCLVPLMQRHNLVRVLVNCVMVKPLVFFGRWRFSDGRLGFLTWPIVKMWFWTWDLCGLLNKKGLKPYGIVA